MTALKFLHDEEIKCCQNRGKAVVAVLIDVCFVRVEVAAFLQLEFDAFGGVKCRRKH